jgi:hypothetical protein
VTSDDSWFFLNALPRRMWTLSKDNKVTKPRLNVQSEKFMFTIMLNSRGFYAVDRLSNDTKMNSDYFVTNMLIRLEHVIFPRGRAAHQKRLVVHLDNCSVHINLVSIDWLEEHGMRYVPHSPYSFDLAPSISTCFLQ